MSQCFNPSRCGECQGEGILAFSSIHGRGCVCTQPPVSRRSNKWIVVATLVVVALVTVGWWKHRWSCVLPEATPEYVHSTQFTGHRKGYVYKWGDQGLGYYWDDPIR